MDSGALTRRGFALLAVAALVTPLACPLRAVAAQAEPPAFAEVKASYATSDAVLLDRHGVLLQRLRLDTGRRRYEWTALDAISPRMAEALVNGEDRRFYDHHGVDWTGLAGVALENLVRASEGRNPRGGSTLTMQLAALLDPALGNGGSRTLGQKWDQAQAALTLERGWTKSEVLEAYLNLATFRGDLTGISAAAQGLFGKDPSGLDADEAAILVALLRAPSASPGAVAVRACTIVRDLASAAADAASSGTPLPKVDCERSRQLAMTRLVTRTRLARNDPLAPHLAPHLLRSPGERVVTTLDAAVQRVAIASLDDHLNELAGRGVEDGAVVVLDNATGAVIAYVGSSGVRSSAGDVDGASAPRQAGSTLKPFLYAEALNRGLLTAASLVDDRPLSIATERGLYAPQDYDYDYRGLVSVRTALASSLNVPAVRTLGLVGDDNFLDTLHAVGLDTLSQDADYYGAALALGSGEVTLLALTNAYRVLANGGLYASPHFLPTDALAPPRRVLGAGAAFIVTDILADRGARAPTFGLENSLATRVWSAAKTGTSKDMRDNWCVGYTVRYTIGVWVGNFSGAPMHDVSGVEGAAPVWRDLVHYLHRNVPSRAPPAPAGLVAAAVAFQPEVEPPRREWFVKGTEMAQVKSDADDGERAAEIAIRYPANDTIIALDPDIPDRHQRVVFTAAGVAGTTAWQLDGVVLATGTAHVDWMPQPGRHVLTLVDAQGKHLSRVSFEVRGQYRVASQAALAKAGQTDGQQHVKLPDARPLLEPDGP
jgi:penicillin-binding protein 1C